MNDLQPETSEEALLATYLPPEQIFEYGISHADESRAEMIHLCRARLGYQHPASVRKFTRNPDKNQHGSGEKNPIHRYETTFHIFRRRSFAAALLMRERFHFLCEVYMHDESAPDEKPFNQNEAVLELTQLIANLREAHLSGQDITTSLAEIEAAAKIQLGRQTKSKATQVREAREAANQRLRTQPVNWRAGDPRAFR